MRTLATGYPPSLLVKKTLMLLVLAPSPAVRSRDTPLGPDADDGHDDHAQRHAKEPNRRHHEGVRQAQLIVRHEPLWPEHAHSSEEEEAAADGVEHANRDVRGLGLAVVAAFGVWQKTEKNVRRKSKKKKVSRAGLTSGQGTWQCRWQSRRRWSASRTRSWRTSSRSRTWRPARSDPPRTPRRTGGM